MYLADDIEWRIFGEKLLQKNELVIKHCDQVAPYFQSMILPISRTACTNVRFNQATAT